jgi:hypothetical protein
VPDSIFLARATVTSAELVRVSYFEFSLVLLSQVTYAGPARRQLDHYRSALLELDPVKLTESIAKAQKAIEQRLQELPQERVDAGSERQALDDASENLRVLARENKNR